MITKEQAMAATYGDELHYTGLGECSRTPVGPRGGQPKTTIIRVRVTGECKTLKTRPEEFRLPIKHGLKGYGEINHLNAHEFHLAEECPLLKEGV